eukprot:1088099_1
MMRSRLHLSVLVFFTFSCLCPTATSNGTASQKSRNMDTDNHLDIIKELLDTFDVVQLPKLYEAEDKYDQSVSGSLKTPPQAKYENTKWISEPYNRPRPPVQVPTKLVATWSRSQHLLRLTATIPPANSELTLYYLEYKRPKMKNKRHLYWFSQRQPLQLNKIDDTLSGARIRMYQRPKEVRVRVEFGGTVLRSGEQTVGDSLGREHALVSGYHRQYTNDDTDLPDELRDIVAKFTDNISSTNNGETEEKKFEENADSDYFVGGHWRSVHRQEDSPTTVSLYIGSPMP